MSLKKIVFLAGFSAVIFTAPVVFAEDAASMPNDSVLITNQQAATQAEGQMQWAWGEVTQIDLQAKTLTLKYLDYETDQEKEMVLTADDKTTFENFKDLDELKVKDTLSIDYVNAPGGVNIAKNISLEKPDEAVIDTTVAAPATPAAAPMPAANETLPAPTPVVMNVDAAVALPIQEPAPASIPAQEPAPTSTAAQEPAATSTAVQEPAPAAQAQ